MPIAPSNFKQLIALGPHQVHDALGGHGGIGIFQANRQGLAAAAIAAQATLHGQYQRQVEGNQIRAANDSFGHVLGQRDAAGGHQSDLIADAGLDQCA